MRWGLLGGGGSCSSPPPGLGHPHSQSIPLLFRTILANPHKWGSVSAAILINLSQIFILKRYIFFPANKAMSIIFLRGKIMFLNHRN